jgi:hypothetical protein
MIVIYRFEYFELFEYFKNDCYVRFKMYSHFLQKVFEMM